MKEINNILQQITKDEFVKMVKFVENHYIETDRNVDKQFLQDFFTVNYSTGIWFKALHNSLSITNYNAIVNFTKDDWEKSDEFGYQFGKFIFDNILN